MALVAFCDYVAGMPQEAPGRSQEQFMVRMPEGMRDRIAEVAKANGRSMNAEVIARLAQSLDVNGPSGLLISGDAITADALVQKIVEGVASSLTGRPSGSPAAD